MTIQRFFLATVIVALFGGSFSFMWIQAGIPSDQIVDPWNIRLQFFPSFFAAWIPLIYLFFTGFWSYIDRKSAREQGYWLPFWKLDIYSYVFLLAFFLWQMNWNEFKIPWFWFRFAVLILLLLKSVILFRALYLVPQLIQPVLLVPITMGIYLLSYPFLHVPFSFALSGMLQHTHLIQFGIILMKSVALSLMMREMFLLSITMTASRQSAFFAWLLVSFTFPAMEFPRISYILAGLLFVFILRMLVSRVNTKELMIGLLEPASVAIGIKFLIILVIVGIAGLIYWSNVKPGFEIHSMRAVESALATLLNGQFGLLSYAPVYWLALFGMLYLVFFRVWNGVLLVIIGFLLYGGYHLAVYGMLEKVVRPYDVVPFLPFFGVFMAVAHHRFGKFIVFRICFRFLAVITAVMTTFLLLLYTDFASVSTKVAELQRYVMQSLHKDLSMFFPSMIFRPYPPGLFFWIGGFFLVAFYCCQIRANSANPPFKKIHHTLESRFYLQHVTLYPLLLGIFLVCGALCVTFADRYSPLPLESEIHLSKQHPQYKRSLKEDQLSTRLGKGLLLVSNLTSSVDIPHGTPLVNIIINEEKEYFETFTLKAGKDTAEVILEQKSIQESMKHGKAAIYRSWVSTTESGITFETHEYYSRILFKKPAHVENMSIKLFNPKHHALPPNVGVHIKEILLLEE